MFIEYNKVFYMPATRVIVKYQGQEYTNNPHASSPWENYYNT